MAKAKLANFTTPTGVQGNLFDLGSIWSLVLGSVVLLATFAMGQNVARAVTGKVPAIDTTPEKPFRDVPVKSESQKRVI